MRGLVLGFYKGDLASACLNSCHMKPLLLFDRAFLREMLAIALPVAFQQLINASIGVIDVVMIGQLGETSVAALGLANQVYFILIVLLFGITSGMSIFSSQYWGRRDVESIRKILGMCLVVSALVAAIFTFAAVALPERILSFYTRDQKVITLGRDYLRIVGCSYIFVAITASYNAVLRSVKIVNIAVIAAAIALIFKAILGYMLIIGFGDLPALEVRGAAIGTASGWTLELILLLILVHAQKTPLACGLAALFTFGVSFFIRTLKTVLPAVANEMVWSLGITTYSAIYAHIGTDAIAAININAAVEELAFVIFMGLGSACAVMVGNHIGVGRKEEAYDVVRNVAALNIGVALLIGGIVYFLRDAVVGLYQLSPGGANNLRNLLLIMGGTLWIRMFNFSLLIGALRAGGDTRFSLAMEFFSIWLIGVPLAYAGAFILNLPVYYVYLIVIVEEIIKAFVNVWRFKSRRWIHELTPSSMPQNVTLKSRETVP